jgi:hypothetical protein
MFPVIGSLTSPFVKGGSRGIYLKISLNPSLKKRGVSYIFHHFSQMAI